MQMRSIVLLTITIGLLVMVPVVMILIDDFFDEELDESDYTFSESRGKMSAVEWEPHGDRIAVVNDWYEKGGDGEEHFLIIWNYSSKETERVIDNSDQFYYMEALSWSPEGSMLAVAGAEVINQTDPTLPWALYAHSRIRIYNTTTWEVIITLKENITFQKSIDWSWDGKYLAGAEFGILRPSSTLIIWNTQSWIPVSRTQQPSIQMIQWHPTNYTLASGHLNGNITIYNATGVPVTHIETHDTRVKAMSWNPNGSILASASSKEICLWDTGGWSRIERRSLSEYGEITSLDWNSEGSRLVIADGYVLRIMSPSGLREQRMMVGHHDWITALSWSHHNDRIVSSSYEGILKFWKV